MEDVNGSINQLDLMNIYISKTAPNERRKLILLKWETT